jgi:hypothetical protein
MPLLRNLHPLAKFGALSLLLLIAGGYLASGALLYFRYEKRDERPGLTIDDIIGAYHGLQSTSPILAAVQRNHPEGMKPEASAAFIAWLTGPRVVEDYDNLDLGDKAPNELLAANCTSCHARKSATSAKPYLEFFDDVKPLASSRKIEPADIKVLVTSTHAHAIALATSTFVLSGLLLMSSRRRAFTGLLIGAMGFSILLDIGSWWITRHYVPGVYGIVAGGAIHNASVALSILVIFFDLLRPAKAA